MPRIPEFKVDHSSFHLVGTKLYSGDLAAIWARETLQNAIDAGAKKVTFTYREGRFPTDSRGNLDFHGILDDWHCGSGPKVVNLTCEDDGCGMDEDVLLDEFLRLGGSFKPGDDSIGGFGVAKAIILSGQRWSVDTNDIHLDNAMMGIEPIRRVERRIGTKIEMRMLVSEERYRWGFSDMRNALLLCNLPGIIVELRREKGDGGLAEIERIHGIRAGKQIDDMGWATVHTNSKRGRSFRGVHVRARGLWQFSKWVSGDVCVFVDIPKMPRPSDHDYPFTLSREGLISPYGVRIDEIVERLITDPSKGRRARNLEEEIIDVWFPKPLLDEESEEPEERVRLVARVGGDDAIDATEGGFENVLPQHGVWSPSVGMPSPVSIHGDVPNDVLDEVLDEVLGEVLGDEASHQETSPEIIADAPSFTPRLAPVIKVEDEFIPLVPFPFLVMKQRHYEKRNPERHIPTMRTLSVFHSLMSDVMDILGLSREMDRFIMAGIVLSQNVVAAHLRHDDIQAILISGEGLRWDDDPNILMPRLLIRLCEEAIHAIGQQVHNEQMVYSTISLFDILMRDHHGQLVEAVQRGRREYERYAALRKRHLLRRT